VSLASDIITAAYREPEIVAKVTAPDTIEVAEGLALLNNLVLSVVGNEVGKELHDIAVGGAYDQSQFVSSWIPENARLVLNLGSAGGPSALTRGPMTGSAWRSRMRATIFATRNLTSTATAG
jgi:hypothetical protein